MPNVERVDSIYNMPAINSEHEQLQKIVAADTESISKLYNTLETFKGKSNVSSVGKNWDTVSTAIGGVSDSSQTLLQIQKQLNDQIAKSAELEKKLSDAQSRRGTSTKKNADLTDEEVRSKYEATQADKLRTKEIIAQTDAYKQLSLQYDQAAAKAKTLNSAIKLAPNGTVTPEQLAAAEAATKEAKAYHDQLVQVEVAVGQAQRKVGSYTDAVKTLEEQLERVNKELAEMEKKGAGSGVTNLTRNPIGFKTGGSNPETPTDKAGTGPNSLAIGFDPQRYAEAKKEAEALTTVIGNQKKGFASTTQEIRIAERNLRTMAAAGLEGSEGFKKLSAEVAHSAREQKEFGEQRKILEDNVPVLKALTVAAKGLAGAYAIGAGASALFSDDEKKVQEHLEKLVAVMTILQGLQEAYELIEKSGTIATVFHADALKGLTGAQLGDAEAALADAEAKKAAATASYEAAEGAEAQALALEELTAATEAVVTAEAEVVVATEAMEAALVAAGIGALILVAAAAVIYLIVKMKEWTAATALSEKQQKDLVDVLGEEVEALQKINDLYDQLSKKSLDSLQHQLELEEKSGQNQYKILAAKQKIADKNAEIADSKYALTLAKAEDMYVKEGLTGIEALHAAQNKYFEDVTEATYKVGVVEKRLSDVKAMSDKERKKANISDKDIERIQGSVELAKSQQALAQKNYEYFYKVEEDKTKAEDEQENLRTEKAKLQEEEKRKYILESANIQADAIKRINDEVLDYEASTLGQRLVAVQSNALQDARKARAAFNDVKNNPGSTDTDIKIARTKLNDELTAIDLAATIKTRELKYAEYVKDRDAQVQIFTLEKQDIVEKNKVILAEEKSRFGDRTKAQAAIYEAERAALGAEFLKEMDQRGLNNEQRLALSKKYESDLIKLNIDYAHTREEEVKREQEKILKDWDDFYSKRKDTITKGESDQVVALNDKLVTGKISPGEYDRQRKEISFNAQKDQAQAQLDADKLQVERFKVGTVERADAEAKLAKDRLDLSDLIAQHEEDNIKKVAELRAEAAKEVEKVFVSIMDSTFDKEIQNIQKQIDRNNVLKEEETKRISESSLQEQQKAATLSVINRNAAAENAALQRHERDVKIRQAKFDRDVAVAEAVEQGAVAALAALKIPIYGEAEAIAIGIITTAKVAEILSRPLPTYGFGTEDHPGGAAWVGDLFEREFIKEPGRSGYWSPAVPTIMDLPAHTQVIPPGEIERMRSDNMFVNDRGVLVTGRQDLAAKRIAEAIDKQTTRLEKAIKQQRKTTIVRNTINTKWGDYIQGITQSH